MEKDYIHDIDQIRKKEYPQLQDTTYLDHAGTTLYSKSLLQQFSTDLSSNLFGNPHSASPSSALSTERVERVRLRTLEFFKADPEHFDIVFVANATAGIKLVMNAFRDYGSKSTSQQPGFWYGYHSDAHTSLVGIREVALAGSRCFRSDEEVEEWLERGSNPVQGGSERPKDSRPALFAYPAQSNMNGHRLPLSWPGRIRSSIRPAHDNMYTLLDAAAYVMTAQLDLSDTSTSPDFTVMSFYKIFGFPDLGAVVVRKAAGHILRQQRYFAGGTVEMVVAVDTDTAWHAKKDHELHDELEDGTLPFHSIIALDAALDTHKRLYGSMARVSAHACYLSKLLYEKMKALQHANGLPVSQIYKHTSSNYGDSLTQGPTVAFNVLNSQGGWVGKSDFDQLAIVHGVQLRTGGVCNPGGIATYLELEPWQLRRNFAEGMRCGNNFDVIAGKPTGIIRVSLGAMSNLRDIDYFIRFVQEVFVENVIPSVPIVRPKTSSKHQNVVQSIVVYPLRGCEGWRIPEGTEWELKQTGLTWDGEWCIVNQTSGDALTVEDYPALRQLKPTLHLRDGKLEISVDTERKGSSSITVSLWDSPPESDENVQKTFAPPRADPYVSPSVAAFFTSFLGMPCTLARYPDRRKVLSPQIGQGSDTNHNATIVNELQNWLHTRPQSAETSSIAPDLPARNCVTVSHNGSSTNTSNIITASPVDTWKYMRIGSQYFQNLTNSTSPQPQSLHSLRHLPNLFDQSLSAQYPTIRVGDTIQIFSAFESSGDAGLRACISSKFSAEYICLVPWCRKQMDTKEERGEHLRHHYTDPTGQKTVIVETVEVGRRSLRKTVSATKIRFHSREKSAETKPAKSKTKNNLVAPDEERRKMAAWKWTLSFRPVSRARQKEFSPY